MLEMDVVRNEFILFCKYLKVELNSWVVRILKLFLCYSLCVNSVFFLYCYFIVE